MQTKEERHPWRIEEDNLIVELVRIHGTKKWTLIAEVLGEKVTNSRRNGKQCRERWHNHLDPMVRKSPWNESEEFVFVEAHKLHGNKWAEIAKMIPGRTDNAIKNHFYSTLRKLISRLQKDEIPPEMKYDPQIRKHTTYLAKYLKNLLIVNQKTSAKQSSDRKHGSLNQFLIDNNMQMGSNDLYVIKKLRESDITQEKIDSYLKKVYLSIKEEYIIPKSMEDRRQSPDNQEKLAKQEINHESRSSSSKNKKPIFQICKEEQKSDGSMSQNQVRAMSECGEEEEMMDYEEFINEGDKLILKDLEVKRDALMRDYASSKQQEQNHRKKNKALATNNSEFLSTSKLIHAAEIINLQKESQSFGMNKLSEGPIDNNDKLLIVINDQNSQNNQLNIGRSTSIQSGSYLNQQQIPQEQQNSRVNMEQLRMNIIQNGQLFEKASLNQQSANQNQFYQQSPYQSQIICLPINYDQQQYSSNNGGITILPAAGTSPGSGSHTPQIIVTNAIIGGPYVNQQSNISNQQCYHDQSQMSNNLKLPLRQIGTYLMPTWSSGYDSQFKIIRDSSEQTCLNQNQIRLSTLPPTQSPSERSGCSAQVKLPQQYFFAAPQPIMTFQQPFSECSTPVDRYAQSDQKLQDLLKSLQNLKGQKIQENNQQILTFSSAEDQYFNASKTRHVIKTAPGNQVSAHIQQQTGNPQVMYVSQKPLLRPNGFHNGEQITPKQVQTKIIVGQSQSFGNLVSQEGQQFIHSKNSPLSQIPSHFGGSPQSDKAQLNFENESKKKIAMSQESSTQVQVYNEYKQQRNQ